MRGSQALKIKGLGWKAFCLESRVKDLLKVVGLGLGSRAAMVQDFGVQGLGILGFRDLKV